MPSDKQQNRRPSAAAASASGTVGGVAVNDDIRLRLLPQNLLAEAQQAFELFADNGQMSIRHLFAALRSMGVDAKDDDVIAIVDDHDPNGRGYITGEQWTAALMRRWAEDDERRKRFRGQLQQATGDSDVPTGQVTTEQLRSVLMSYVPTELTATDVDLLVACADFAGLGYVDYNDFLAFVVMPSKMHVDV